MSASTWRTRSAFVAKRGSAPSAGRCVRLGVEHLGQPPELTVVAHRQHHEPVGRGDGLVRRDARMPVAEPPGHDPGVEICRCLVDQAGQQAREQVDLDPLTQTGPFPVQQGGQDAGDQVLPGQHVHHGDPDFGRITVSWAGHRHQAADGLDQEVVPGRITAARGRNW